MIYYTGDMVDHAIWATSPQNNKEEIGTIHKLLIEKFKSQNIQIYPIIGNHESSPVNQYPPSSISNDGLSNQWLFDYLATNYSSFLNADSLNTIKKGGYYTVLVKPSMSDLFEK